jgi:hypothetical protein
MDAYVLWNGSAWFVKEATFFKQQKAESIARGETREWWKNWRAVYGVDGIEHARDKARLTWGEKGERW